MRLSVIAISCVLFYVVNAAPSPKKRRPTGPQDLEVVLGDIQKLLHELKSQSNARAEVEGQVLEDLPMPAKKGRPQRRRPTKESSEESDESSEEEKPRRKSNKKRRRNKPARRPVQTDNREEEEEFEEEPPVNVNKTKKPVRPENNNEEEEPPTNVNKTKKPVNPVNGEGEEEPPVNRNKTKKPANTANGEEEDEEEEPPVNRNKTKKPVQGTQTGSSPNTEGGEGTPALPEERKKNGADIEAEADMTNAPSKNNKNTPKNDDVPEVAVRSIAPNKETPEENEEDNIAEPEVGNRKGEPSNPTDNTTVKPKPVTTPATEVFDGQKDSDIINVQMEQDVKRFQKTKSAGGRRKIPGIETLDDDEGTKGKWDNPGGFPIPFGAEP